MTMHSLLRFSLDVGLQGNVLTQRREAGSLSRKFAPGTRKLWNRANQETFLQDARITLTAAAASQQNGPIREKHSTFSHYRGNSSRGVACRAGATLPDNADPDEDRKQFFHGCENGNLVPLYRKILSDQLTPVLAYRCLVKEDQREAPSFLFEAVEHGDKSDHEGRFSSLGTRPVMEIVAKEYNVSVLDHAQSSREEKMVDDPISELEVLSSKWKPVKVDGIPDTFCGGWVGYFSYDTVRYVEKTKLPFETAADDDRGLPDIHLGLYTDVIVFDHVDKVVYVVHWVQVNSFPDADEAYNDGKEKLAHLVDQLQAQRPKLASGKVDMKMESFWKPSEGSNMTQEEYRAKVLAAKEHIKAGDIFQVVLSQRFERCTTADPFEVYRSLRVLNPSPYMIYLQARGSTLVGASPEILTKIVKGKVVNRPLAGTRRRGKTYLEDQHLEMDLRDDQKEVAEHIMLVDLGRNDVGKVSKPGSVKVEKLMDIERYSHVMHLSSTVTGELRNDVSPWDALRAALPVGTVSGAPKVRAMQLIDEMEPTRRGPYSGGVGHISFTGEMDIALALRTMVFPTDPNFEGKSSMSCKSCKSSANPEPRSQRLVYLQAGAGIVADSDPESEHQECINKASGMSRAIDLAESTFPAKQTNEHIKLE